MTIERLGDTRAETEVRREDFGPGFAGEISFKTVLGGSPCIIYIDETKEMCGKPPIGTLGVDIGASYDVFPYCSEEHASLLEKQLIETTATFRSGVSSVIDKNGLGRGNGNPA